MTFAADSGTYSPEEAGFGEEALLELTLLRQADGTWYIQSVEEPGTC